MPVQMARLGYAGARSNLGNGQMHSSDCQCKSIKRMLIRTPIPPTDQGMVGNGIIPHTEFSPKKGGNGQT